MAINFIKNLVEKNIGEIEHKKFIRFSKGTFEREKFTIQRTSLKIKISSGFEYNDILQLLLSECINKKTEESKTEQRVSIIGYIFSRTKEKPDKILDSMNIDYNIKGKKYIIAEELNNKSFTKLLNSIKQFYALLNIKSENFSLSVKKSLPKPGKLVENFCKATFELSCLDKIKKEFLFDFPTDNEFKTIEIKHTYKIEDIIIPEEYKDNYEMIRLKAKKRGKIMREINDKKNIIKKEYDFEA